VRGACERHLCIRRCSEDASEAGIQVEGDLCCAGRSVVEVVLPVHGELVATGGNGAHKLWILAGTRAHYKKGRLGSMSRKDGK